MFAGSGKHDSRFSEVKLQNSSQMCITKPPTAEANITILNKRDLEIGS
jgi:hypothetical protein